MRRRSETRHEDRKSFLSAVKWHDHPMHGLCVWDLCLIKAIGSAWCFLFIFYMRYLDRLVFLQRLCSQFNSTQCTCRKWFYDTPGCFNHTIRNARTNTHIIMTLIKQKQWMSYINSRIWLHFILMVLFRHSAATTGQLTFIRLLVDIISFSRLLR